MKKKNYAQKRFTWLVVNKSLRLAIILIFSFTQRFYSQNSNTELNDLVFENIINNCNTPFLLNLGNAQSKIFGLQEIKFSKIDANDWFLAYNDLMISYIPKTNPFDSIGKLYTKMALKRHEVEGDILKLPIGVIYTDYNFVDVERNLENKRLSISSNNMTLLLNDKPESVIEKRTIFATCLLMDTVSIYETIRMTLYDEFNISKESIAKISLFKNGIKLGEITNGSFIDVSLNPGINDFNVTYQSSNGEILHSEFRIFGEELPVNKSAISGVFSVNEILNTPNETFSTLNIDGEVQSAEIKIFYGCNNPDKLILKPAIMIMGYNPLNIENFVTLATKYNTNGYLTALHERNYDVIIIRFNYGADRIENHALLAKRIIKEINHRKFTNDSYFENILTGYSAGALVGRIALKMLEVDYDQNPVLENLHHSRLLISYDGEHQGANVPLSAQHAIRSIIENPQWYLPFLGLSDALEQYFLITSPLAKDFLIYHYTQTGNETSPYQDAHPFYYEIRNKLNSEYFYHPAPYDKPGNYPIIRNIGVSDGSAEPSMHPIGLLPLNSSLLKIDKNYSILGWDRHNTMEWKAVDGQGHFVFKRKINKKPFFSPNYTVVLDEQKFVNNNSVNMDGVQGSTVNLYSALLSAVKYTYLAFNPDIEVKSTDCFLPTSSALDITAAGLSTFEVNLRSENLLWWTPQTNPPGDEQLKQYGYPSIIHGVNQYAKTPFDAIYAAKINLKHGAGSEKLDDAPYLTEFMLEEVQYDHIWLQFLRIGIWSGYNLQHNYYPVHYEATKTIRCGEQVTHKTQHKPFIANPNAQIEMKAGESVSFEPGTHIKNGAILHAYIEQTVTCTSTGKMMEITQEGEESEQEENTLNNKQMENVYPILNVYPNPNTGVFTIENPTEENQSFEIYTISGTCVYSGVMHEKLKVVTLNLKEGLYILKLKNQNNPLSTKIIIQ
jgi:hypothetical protein